MGGDDGSLISLYILPWFRRNSLRRINFFMFTFGGNADAPPFARCKVVRLRTLRRMAAYGKLPASFDGKRGVSAIAFPRHVGPRAVATRVRHPTASVGHPQGPPLSCSPLRFLPFFPHRVSLSLE